MVRFAPRRSAINVSKSKLKIIYSTAVSHKRMSKPLEIATPEKRWLAISFRIIICEMDH
jgi:hypothetical protein